MLVKAWPFLLFAFILGLIRNLFFRSKEEAKKKIVNVKYAEVSGDLLEQANDIANGVVDALGTRDRSNRFFEDEEELKRNLVRILPAHYDIVDDYYKTKSSKSRSMEQDVSRLITGRLERIRYIPSWIRAKYGYEY